MNVKPVPSSHAEEVIFPSACSLGGFVQIRTATSVRTGGPTLQQSIDIYEIEEITSTEIARSMAMGRDDAEKL